MTRLASLAILRIEIFYFSMVFYIVEWISDTKKAHKLIAVVIVFFIITTLATVLMINGVSDHIVLPATIVAGLLMPSLLSRLLSRIAEKKDMYSSKDIIKSLSVQFAEISALGDERKRPKVSKKQDGEGGLKEVRASRKSRLIALLLCLLTGWGGGHRFYVNKVGTGLAMLFTMGGFGMWYFLDLVMIASGLFKDKENLPVTNWSSSRDYVFRNN